MKRLLMIWLTMLLLQTGLQAQSASIFHQQGTAVYGYYVVAFFTNSKAVAGRPDYHHQWQGVNWLFASAAHRYAFAAAPERYAPQYGGWLQGAYANRNMDYCGWKTVL